MATAEELLPCPTHEGGGVYVNGFPSGPKPYEEVLTFLRKGTELLKYGRIGSPKYHPFRLSNDDLELQWESKKNQVRRIPLSCITRWQRGQETPVFRRLLQPKLAKLSFSIFYQDEKGSERTLDVICNNSYDFEMWFWGVQIIRYYPPHMWSAPTPLQLQLAQGNQPYSNSMQQSSRQMQQQSMQPPPLEIPSLRSSYADDRGPSTKTPKTAKPMTGLSVMVGGRTGAMPGGGLGPPTRRDRRELGDLYVWGSLLTHETDEWAGKAPPPSLYHEAMRDWQQSGVPVLVQNAGSVDVVRVACAPRHAALITRKGELYTWGYGATGNLGHGLCTNLASPRLVTRMSGKGVRMVACGEGATAAISADMRLYIWGSGEAGQLGNGYAFPMAEPMPVIFPGLREDARVLTVSCGPYHTAAITEGGLLFTWGSGLFGKLGHGSHASEYRPRRVAALENNYVTCVSCGYWHTAAVVAPRTTGRSTTTPFGTVVTPPAATPATTASPLPPVASAPVVTSVPAEGARERNLRHAASEMSSSGSDLQGVAAAAAAAAATSSAPALATVSASAPAAPLAGGPSTGSAGAAAAANGTNGAASIASAGGGAASASAAAPLLGAQRSDMLSSSVASMEQLARDTQDASSSCVASGSSGTLYTWGGDFSWTEPAEPSKRGGEHAPPKRDHHGGCLGVGDKEGRLLPARVRGDMDKHGIVQVACGWSMTVALSRDGRVYQMGTTGAPKTGEKSCPWEGALNPTRVDGNLFGMFVEEVACGMHHVVVVASKVQANGQIPDEGRRIRLLTWGRGSEGQLGVDSGAVSASSDGPLTQRILHVDFTLPQVVGQVDGKRVLHISAGGNHTMAVIEHDPRVRRHHASTPAATPTPMHGGALAAAAAAGAATSRSGSYAPSAYHGGAQALSLHPAPVRDTSLLTSPFTAAAQSIPVAAAAGFQSLQQMVTGPKASRGDIGSSASASTARPGAPGRATSGRRHQSGRVVTMPAAVSYMPGISRSEHHRTDLRRNMARTHHHYGPGGPAAAGGGGPGQSHFGKSASLNSHATKGLEPAVSVSSSGMLSHRSSPPLVKGADDGDSRSISPTSSSLYDMSSTTGELPHHSAPALARQNTGGRLRPAAAHPALHGALRERDRAHASGPARLGHGVEAAREGSIDTQSLGGHSLAETEGDTDPYFMRGRRGSLDMVPEQTEESPGSPATGGSRAARRASHAVRGGQAYMDSHDSAELVQVVAMGSEGAAAQAAAHPQVHPRVAMLARASGGGGGGGSGSGGDAMRSSVDSFTTGASGSSGLSPSGLGTPSPETPDDAMHSHPARSGMPGGPYSLTLPEAATPSPQPPTPTMPFMSPGGQGGAAPQRHDSRVGPAAAAAALAAGTVSSNSLSVRPREVSISAWAQPGAQAAAAAAVGPGGVSALYGGAEQQGGAFRPEATFRVYGEPGDATAGSGGGGLGPPRTSVVVPQGSSAGPRGSSARGSRGHSRHTSYDSVEGGSGRDPAEAAMHRRSGSTAAAAAAAAFELVPPPAHPSSGSQTPPRLTSATVLPAPPSAADAAAMALKHQNDALLNEVMWLRQQMAQMMQGGGMGGAAGVATSGGAVAAGYLSGTPPQLPPAPVGTIHNNSPAHTGPLPHPVGPGEGSPSPGHYGGAGSSSGTSAAGTQSPAQLLPGPPLHLTHASSMSAAAAAAAAAAATTSPGHGLPPLSPSSTRASAGPSMMLAADRQMGGMGVPPSMGGPPPNARHRRATSVDVSSLIATRDGIGPARDYLAPAPSLQAASTQVSQASLHAGGGVGSSSAPGGGGGPLLSMRDGTVLGHATAPPGLDALRQHHPGMSLAQAALAEADEEGLDEDDEEGEGGDEVEPGVEGEAGEEGEEGDADGEADTDMDDSRTDGAGTDVVLPPPAMLMPLAGAASLRRQLYVAPSPPQQLPSARGSGGHPGFGYEAHGGGSREDSFARHRGADTSEASSSVSGGAYDGPGGDGDDGTGTGASSGAPGRPRRRQAFVDMQTLQQPQLGSAGGGSAGGGGAGGAGRSGGGVLSGEEAYAAGNGLAANTPLAPDGSLFQYVPGVFITLRPPQQPGGRVELCKLRFSRRVFSQAEAQQWWAAHKAELYDVYHVTASVGGGTGGGGGGGGGGHAGSRSATPGYPASPSGASPGHLVSHSSPQPGPMHGPAGPGGGPATSHTRGFSTDTQGTSASGGAQPSGFFSLPMHTSPAHGMMHGGGSGGSAAGAMYGAEGLGRGSGSYWASSAMATSGGAPAGDPNATWADQTYDDASTAGMMPYGQGQAQHHPGLTGMGSGGGLGAGGGGAHGGIPPRHHRSRSGSRTASGGASTGGLPGGFGGVPPGPGGQWTAGGGGGGPTHTSHHHARSRSGGAVSTRSNLSNRS